MFICYIVPPDCACLSDLHVEPPPGSSLSTQELMTRLCFLLGDVTPGTVSSPMEDRREKKVGQHIHLVGALVGWMVDETSFCYLSPHVAVRMFFFS